MKRSHYAELGVSHNATLEDIQHAYRTLALRYHPDRNAAPDAAARMTAINEAWEVLGDPRRRRDYDAETSRPATPPGVAAAVLVAAREIVLRGGWRVLEDSGKTLLLERSRDKLRVVFIDRIDSAGLLRLVRQGQEFCVVLAVDVDGLLQAGPSLTVIDLMKGQRYGSTLPQGAAQSLFAVFL